MSMEKQKEELGLALFGRSRAQSAASSTCVMCGGVATEFRDALSEKEYKISFMCQKCQDDFYGTGG
jgi:uncharacterized CHY-type Zn-finger protein